MWRLYLGLPTRRDPYDFQSSTREQRVVQQLFDLRESLPDRGDRLGGTIRCSTMRSLSE